MQHKLPDLPYSKEALSPHISPETIEFHYAKHHQAYVNNLNNLIPGTEFENATLEEIVKKAKGPIFNNAAQVWNHTFYWHCLSPKGGGNPTGKVKDLIEKKWGTFEKFKEDFSKQATSNFGSGWTWLIQNNQGEVEILNTSNADTPLAHDGKKSLMTIDVWEHAYYVDYRNQRPKYIEIFWNLVNWEFVNNNL